MPKRASFIPWAALCSVDPPLRPLRETNFLKFETYFADINTFTIIKGVRLLF